MLPQFGMEEPAGMGVHVCRAGCCSSLPLEEKELQTSSAVIPMMDVLCQRPCILICSQPDLAQCFTSKSQQFTGKELTQGSRKAEALGTDKAG